MVANESNPDREFVTTRVLHAPRDLVFKVWTDPQHIGQWWGPRGFTLSTKKMEFKPGGQWIFTMHGPDGKNFEQEITYKEIIPGNRIVYAQCGDAGRNKIDITGIVTFEDVAGGTRITLRMILPSAEIKAFVIREYHADTGAQQNADRMTEYVAMMAQQNAEDVFVIARVLNAPPELVYKVWTQRDHLVKWFGPADWETTSIRFTFKVGGEFVYKMTHPTLPVMYGKWVFTEIEPVKKLAFVSSFSDEQGNVTRAPFAATWPMQTNSTLSLSEYDGRTLLVIQSQPINPTDDERKTFIGGKPSMTKGWGGTLEKLVEYLKNV